MSVPGVSQAGRRMRSTRRARWYRRATTSSGIDECEAANLLTKDGGGSHRPFEALNPTIAKRRNADARVGKSGSFRRYSSIIARRLSGQRTPTVVACLLAGRSLFLVGISPPDHHPARASRLDRGRLLERKPELTRRDTSSWKRNSVCYLGNVGEMCEERHPWDAALRLFDVIDQADQVS
jgi:hypothetical protein